MAAAPELGRATQIEPIAPRARSLYAADLFESHSRRIYAYCLRHLRSPEEAEDAVQATFLSACRHLMRGFEPEGPSVPFDGGLEIGDRDADVVDLRRSHELRRRRVSASGGWSRSISS